MAKEKEKKKKEQEEKLEKRKDADLAFTGWKNRKAAKAKEEKEKKKLEDEKLEESKVAEHEDSRPGTAQSEAKESENLSVKPESVISINPKCNFMGKSFDKETEAKLAYEAWLDYIEARDEERMMFDEERKKILMWKPPWCPGGKAMF